MVATLSSCLLVLTVSSVAQIPKDPDFSGEWVLVQATGSAFDPASALTVRQTITRTTKRGEPMPPWFSDLAVERHFKHGVESDTYKIRLVGGTMSGAGETRVAVTWDRASLIIRTGTYSGPLHEHGPYTEHEEVWSFDSDGRLVIAISDRSSTSHPTTWRLIYQRDRTPIALSRPGVCEREAAKFVGTVPARVGKDVPMPEKIFQVHPEYPSLPADTRVKSNTWVGEILLDATGAVSQVWTIREMQFVPPFPAFNRAVIGAVAKWRFEPAMIDGKAIPLCMTTSVRVDF
jgi:hypothetical protein